MKEKHFVIAYDVSDDKRRNRLSKLLLDYAFRVQKSVYEFRSTLEECSSILEKLLDVIEVKEDSVIVYELSDESWKNRLQLGKETGEPDLYAENFVIL